MHVKYFGECDSQFIVKEYNSIRGFPAAVKWGTDMACNATEQDITMILGVRRNIVVPLWGGPNYCLLTYLHSIHSAWAHQ